MNTYSLSYTFPNCITRCRIRSIIALCRCLPFQMPLQLVENLEHIGGINRGIVFSIVNHDNVSIGVQNGGKVVHVTVVQDYFQTQFRAG